MGAVFDDSLVRVLGKCQEIGAGRGVEYADSWHPSNVVGIFSVYALDAVKRTSATPTLSPEDLRLIHLGSLIDVKMSRIVSGGDHKEDNYLDLINYIAVFADLMGQRLKDPTF